MSTQGEKRKKRKREEEDEEWRIRPLSAGTRDIVPENILFNPAINPAYRKFAGGRAVLNINYVADYVIKRVFVVIGRTGLTSFLKFPKIIARAARDYRWFANYGLTRIVSLFQLLRPKLPRKPGARSRLARTIPPGSSNFLIGLFDFLLPEAQSAIRRFWPLL